MTSSTRIWIVDAFTSHAYAGNPAGVMIVDEFPPHAQSIAAEMNLSETAFVKPLGASLFHIRWLTPAVEVKLCGHATLASAHILFQEKRVSSNELTFESLSGPLHVTKQGDALVLDFPLQKTGNRLEKKVFAENLGIDENEIVEVVSAFDDVIVAVEHESVVRKLVPDFAKLLQIPARGIIVTSRGERHDFVSRFFGPAVGVNEDPVTGSAHCKLADYWSRKLNKKTMTAYQASQRGGELGIEVRGDRVLLKGTAVTIMEGRWKV